MVNSEKFWNKAAEKYAKSPIKDMNAYNKTLELTKNHLSQDDNVLEFGCGTGSTALLLADSVNHIIASDISGNMIEIAKAKAQDQQIENVSFVKGTLSDNSLRKNSFDAIMAFNILHLIEDLPQTIARIDELLKPQGLFISKTVCMAEKSRLWAILLPIMRAIGLAPYVRLMKIRELENFITSKGFEIIETGNYPASPPSRFIIARKR